jgi:hypothetical protein
VDISSSGKGKGGGIWFKYFIPMYENRTMKLGVEGEREGVGKRGGEFNQDLMYACVDVSQ